MNKKWWMDEVIYQIYPKSFKDTNNDGIGDLQGIIEKLPYLNKLGITSIWICPIFKSPMVDNGYDISDYLDIAPEYGTIEDLRELVDTAKTLNIKIILDLVVNHTSDEHKWFQKALADPTSKYREYYIFKESEERPNNWRSVFGGSVWEKLPDENVYYYHTFDKKQPDLNWENPKLREEIYQMVRKWLDFGIAGFRVDAITFIKKDLSFASAEPDGVDGLVKCATMSRNYPGIEVFLEELRKETFEPYDAVTIAEAAGVSYEDLEKYIGEDGFFSMIFDFQYSDLDVSSGSEWFNQLDWTWEDLFQKIETSQKELQGVGWGAPFIENHDQQRATTKYLKEYQDNREAVKSMAIMYYFLQGTAFIYQGQELGMVNFERDSIDEFDDISSIDQYYRGIEEGFTEDEMLAVLNYRSRDNARTPMPWTGSENAGFSEGELWLKLTESYPEINVEQQQIDKNSVLNFYKKMIAFKKGEYAELLNFGGIDFLPRQTEGVFLYRRYNEERSVVIVTNLTNDKKEVILENNLGKILFKNQSDIRTKSQKILLPPFGAAVIEEQDK